MLKFLFILLLTFSTFSTFAGEKPACTAWTQQDGISCIMAGQFANIYQRECENPCWSGIYNQGNMGPNCDKQQVCNFNNPTTFKGVCSEWIKVSGISCYDSNSQSWEQSWVRSCTVGLSESSCSREMPFE